MGGKRGAVKRAVPARRLRIRGAASAFELALAGVYLLSRMASCDSLTVAASPPSTCRIIQPLAKLSTLFCD
jgi:hypothetical protein